MKRKRKKEKSETKDTTYFGGKMNQGSKTTNTFNNMCTFKVRLQFVSQV